ncbi:MAG TPA: hypothetical protein VK277_10635 [Acidimicrobiales bacterium]|nr:hypothetical protein [Acidimicrobiales bacterium]
MRGSFRSTGAYWRAVGALVAAVGAVGAGAAVAPAGAAITTSTTSSPAGPVSTPAANLQRAVRATLATSGFTMKGYQKIDREGFKLGLASNVIYQAPDRTIGGTVGKPLGNITIGTTRYLRETMVCSDGTHAYWWWASPLLPSENAGAAATSYLRQLLRLPNLRQEGSTFTSRSLGPATNPTYKQAFGPGKVLTVATVVVKGGYVYKASYRYSSPKAVLENGITYLKIGTSPPVPSPPAALVFPSMKSGAPPKPPSAIVCAGH